MAIIKCPACGKEFPDSLQACPNCGRNPFVPNEHIPPQYAPQIKKTDNKSKVLAGVLCLFLWGFGVHEFYLGSAKRGLACIFTNIFMTIIAAFVPILGVLLVLVPIIFAIKLFIMPQEQFDLKYNSPTSPKSKIGCLIAILVFGFTLPIIGILAAIALPQYFMAVEKARAAEAISLMSTISGSQQRYYLAYDKFVSRFNELDLSDVYNLVDKNGEKVGNTSSFETNNFTINLKGEGSSAYVEAARNGGRFPYILRRYYITGKTQCLTPNTDSSICRRIGISAE